MERHEGQGPESGNVRMQWNVKIPLRDGIQLSAILYLPANLEDSVPAVFAMTPYVAQTHHERGMYFATHGYPFLNVDVRGRGNSEGSFHPLNEAEDGYDIVEWIARQSWCNGQVAMCGGSYGAYCQWATAKEFPPHLATIVPVASPFRGVDSPMRNNIFPTYAMQWLTHVSGRTSQDRIFSDRLFWRRKYRGWFESGIPFAQLDEVIGNPSPLFQEWLSHPEPDEYWDRHNPTPEQYSRLSIPILTITGAYDSDQRGALEHYRRHVRSLSPGRRPNHYLIIGPWNHAGCTMPVAEFGGLKLGTESLLDLRSLQRHWYAWAMQRGDRPEFLQKNVAYYVIGADQWRYADSLEAITARSEPLYLSSTSNPTDVFRSGALTCEPPAAGGGHDHYVYDPRDVDLAELEASVDPQSLTDQRIILARIGRHLVYHSAPFETDTEVSGFFTLSLWLSIDQPDTDFRAAIYEVALDGSTILLTADWMRARYRENPRVAKLIDTPEPLRYDFERFTFVSRQILKAHRLRLVIGPIDSIRSQKNHNSGGRVSEESINDARRVTVRLFHDHRYPSALYVPIGQSDY